MHINPIFASNMVFAAHQPIRIYGEGEGEAEVTFAGEARKAVSRCGVWEAEFPPMDYGGPYCLRVTYQDGEEVFTNVYVGEVYLMAGQSNMQFKLKESNAPAAYYQTNPLLRLFSAHRIEKTDRFTPEDGWVPATEENAGDWTALGYLMGNKLSTEKQVAVGILTAYQGASVIESWLPKGLPEENGISLPPEALHGDHLSPEFALWKQEGTLYNYALSQLFPFSLSAVVWYQGESDTSVEEGKVYTKELALLVETLRKDFRQPALPVAVVCIADYLPRSDEGWKAIQTAQIKAGETIPNVKTVLSADICETDSIHPPTKHLLASRLAEAVNRLL